MKTLLIVLLTLFVTISLADDEVTLESTYEIENENEINEEENELKEDDEDDGEYELEDDEDDEERRRRRRHRHFWHYRNWWLRRHWMRNWRRQMRRWRRQQEDKRRRMQRLREMHRRRFARKQRARALRRAMMKRLHVKTKSSYKKRIIAAEKRIANQKQMFKILKNKIIQLIYKLRQTKDAKQKVQLTAELKTVIDKSKEIRKAIVSRAVKQNIILRKLDNAKKVKAAIKKIYKEKVAIANEKRVIKAMNIIDSKINVLKHDHKYNAKKFQRAVAKEIKRTCKHLRITKKVCKKIANKMRSKVKYESKKIVKRYNKKQANLKKNLEKRIEGKMVKQTVKGMAKKFERNYHVMDKYRRVLDVTCRMDPKSCNFFRRSFGDMVPMF
ncbi:hypothetical protein ENUP19_0388G0003 [Entamoeba nuttalli]|uniref:Uncharacterized protein n=2 Tax=Entamoeba nuttalli TaxID=412467 RepID=A0ABQ0DZF3_9EUKA